MDNVTPFGRRGGQGGRGPDDPDLNARVARLEDGQVRIEAAILRVESALAQTNQTLHRVEVEQAETKGRIKGIEDRFSSMPTSLQLISVVIALVVAAGLFRFFEPRYSLPPAPTVTTPR